MLTSGASTRQTPTIKVGTGALVGVIRVLKRTMCSVRVIFVLMILSHVQLNECLDQV